MEKNVFKRNCSMNNVLVLVFFSRFKDAFNVDPINISLNITSMGINIITQIKNNRILSPSKDV